MRPLQKLGLCALALPVLYFVHLILLEVYSSILLGHDSPHGRRPPGPPWERPGDDQFSGDRPPHDYGPDRPPPPGYGHDYRPPGDSPPSAFQHHFPPPTESSRASDTIDTFASYAHADLCNISSLSLHIPFSPLCNTRDTLLAAMSDGGRPGFDMPYIPRGCDMRWFSTAEICDNLSRFSRILFIGDSIMRHVVNALYVFLREDIAQGGITDWSIPYDTEKGITQLSDCQCDGQTSKHICSDAVIADTAWVPGNASLWSASPLRCPAASTPRLSWVRSNSYPASAAELDEISDILDRDADTDTSASPADALPVALVLHSTFWNNVNLTSTLAWLDQLTAHIASAHPHLQTPASIGAAAGGTAPELATPALFMTANAGGLGKNSMYLDSQGNQALGTFEKQIAPELATRGIELLGCFNMSVQSVTSDGTHASFEANLLKAMMVVNWLSMVET